MIAECWDNGLPAPVWEEIGVRLRLALRTEQVRPHRVDRKDRTILDVLQNAKGRGTRGRGLRGWGGTNLAGILNCEFERSPELAFGAPRCRRGVPPHRSEVRSEYRRGFDPNRPLHSDQVCHLCDHCPGSNHSRSAWRCVLPCSSDEFAVPPVAARARDTGRVVVLRNPLDVVDVHRLLEPEFAPPAHQLDDAGPYAVAQFAVALSHAPHTSRALQRFVVGLERPRQLAIGQAAGKLFSARNQSEAKTSLCDTRRPRTPSRFVG